MASQTSQAFSNRANTRYPAPDSAGLSLYKHVAVSSDREISLTELSGIFQNEQKRKWRLPKT
jgi:hypothetical protein